MTRAILILTFLYFLQYNVYCQSNDWVNITKEGASNDGKKSITEVLKKVIDNISAKGGGTVYFPAGEYLTGAIVLKSNITLHIDAGAVLNFSDNFDDYLPYIEMRWEGIVMKSFHPLISARDAENVTITGRGTINGQGKRWWDETLKNVAEIRKIGKVENDNKWQKLWYSENKDLKVPDYYKSTLARKFFRPPFIQTYRCKNVLIEGITIINSPFWTVNPEFCDNVTVQGVTIRNPESPNTDGINPESCSNVHISNCHISVGDDCITIKSGRDQDGRNYNIPSENITITNCTMLNGHGGVVIGSEMSGSVKNVVISNCIFNGTDRGIRIKTSRGRGGVVENISADNIVMSNIRSEAILFDMLYGKTEEGPVTEETPCFRDFYISNIYGINVKQAGFIRGIAELPIKNISFSNINLKAEKGFEVSFADQVEFHNVALAAKTGSILKIQDVTNTTIENIKSTDPGAGIPLIALNNVSEVFIYSCFPYRGTDIFLQVDGAKSRNILMKNNNFSFVKSRIKMGNDVKPEVLSEIISVR